jgi:hypothetical protein
MEAGPSRTPAGRRPGPDGGERAARGRLPTGWAALDAQLGGGWPAGELAELVGRGRSTLALAAVARAQAAGQPVAWVDGSGTFCPAACGVDLSRLTLVRPPAARPARAKGAGRTREPAARAARERGVASPALLAADLLLRSRAFGLLVLDLPGGRPPLASWFRLARQAARAGTVLLLLGGAEGAVAGSAAGLTLRVGWRHAPAASWEPAPPPVLELMIARARGPGAAHGAPALVLPLPAPAEAGGAP